MELQFLITLLTLNTCFARQTIWQSLKDRNVNRMCKTVSSFTPQFCRYGSAKKHCSSMCTKMRSSEDFLTCGKKKTSEEELRKVLQQRFRRIVGGRQSQQGEWPWHVSLRINGTQWCGGSILSEKLILTAAHCFDSDITSENAKDWKVYAGDHSLTKEDRREQVIQVKKILPHPKYRLSVHEQKKWDWLTAKHDIAILELEEKVNLHDDNKATLCLPSIRRIAKPDKECLVAGWGHTSFNGTQPDQLKHAVVKVVSSEICNEPLAYNGTVDKNNLICAGYKKGGTDACNYDSGGAMICEKKDRWYACGIVSSGYECARANAYGLYTRVQWNTKWVVDILLNAAVKKHGFI